MKRRRWLILIVGSLLGMLFVPKLAYSMQFDIVEIIQPVMPLVPVTLPGRRLPFPNAIPGPLIQLPIPAIPDVCVPGRIEIRPFAAATRPQAKGFFPAAQKMFASSPDGKGPSEQQLKTGFDQGVKPSAAGSSGAVEVKVEDKPEPQKKKRPESHPVIQVPTWELEEEIGI